jgi:hypothetical protein
MSGPENIHITPDLSLPYRTGLISGKALGASVSNLVWVTYVSNVLMLISFSQSDFLYSKPTQKQVTTASF